MSTPTPPPTTTPPPPLAFVLWVLKLACGFVSVQGGFFGTLIGSAINYIVNRHLHQLLLVMALLLEALYVTLVVLVARRYCLYGVDQWHNPLTKFLQSLFLFIGFMAIAMAIALHIPFPHLRIFFICSIVVGIFVMLLPLWGPVVFRVVFRDVFGDVSHMIFGEAGVANAVVGTTATNADAALELATVGTTATIDTDTTTASEIPTGATAFENPMDANAARDLKITIDDDDESF